MKRQILAFGTFKNKVLEELSVHELDRLKSELKPGRHARLLSAIITELNKRPEPESPRIQEPSWSLELPQGNACSDDYDYDDLAADAYDFAMHDGGGCPFL